MYIHRFSHFVKTMNSKKQFVNKLHTEDCQEVWPFDQPVKQATQRKEEACFSKEREMKSMTYPSEMRIIRNLHRKFLQMLQFLPKNLQQDKQDEVQHGNFYRRVDQSQKTMESITI